MSNCEEDAGRFLRMYVAEAMEFLAEAITMSDGFPIPERECWGGEPPESPLECVKAAHAALQEYIDNAADDEARELK